MCSDGGSNCFLVTEGKSANPSSWSITVTPAQLFPVSRHILCIRLLNWPIDRLCRRRADLRNNPLALITTVGNRRHVSAACLKARANGVRPDIDQAEANAICPSLVCLPHDLEADARGLRSLGRWMMRFTPVVSIDPAGSPDALLLDVTGCERIFRGLDRLAGHVVRSLECFKLSASVAIGPNPGAAWAATFVRNRTCHAKHAVHVSQSVSHIPCEALRLDPDTVARLYHLGIQTLGQLLNIPRDQLPARFGKLLTLRLDQLLGHTPEPLVPLELPPIISASMDFDGVITAPETLWAVFRGLLARIISQLNRHGRGVREMDVIFVRAYAPTILKTIRLSRPSRDPVNLFNLFRCATEQMQDENSSDEFLGMKLHVRIHEPLPDEQIDLLDGEHYAGEIELDRLIERLCARLGERSITRAQPLESHIPERAYRRGKPDRSRKTMKRSRADEDNYASSNARPLLLLPRPLEIPVTVNPFNDTFGQPMQFTAQTGRVHRLSHVIGPERIGGQWWDGHNKTRDYFDVEDETGERFWLFRVNETRRWYLHGQYA